MKTYILAGASGLVLSMFAFMMLFTSSASAAVDTCTWTGSGDGTSFSDGSNWSVCDNGGVPENGDTIEFDMSTATQFPRDETLTNDISGLILAGINLTGSNGSWYGYTISGSAIRLTGDITGDQTDGRIYLDLNVTLDATINYSVPSEAIIFGYSDNAGTYSLDLSTYDFNVASTHACGLFIYHDLFGSGNITSSSGASGINLVTGGDGSFTGNITTDGVGVAIWEDAIGSSTTVTVNGSGRLYLIDVADHTYDVVMNSSGDPALVSSYTGFACGGGGTPAAGTVTLSGDLTLQRDTIYQGFTHSLNVTGTFTSNGNVLSTKTGSQGSITTSEGTIETEAQNTVIAAGDESSAYLEVANKETTTLNGARGSVYVGSGGILKGTGEAESITVDVGGTLAPGLSPGCLTATSGGIVISGTYDVEIAGTAVCTEYDQTDVTGTVQLNTESVLDVSFLNSFVPAVNDSFIIISNDGADAVTGTFNGLDNGDTFEVSGVTFRINYDGGDGNDVVLTATAVPEAPDTGIETVIQNPMITAGLALVTISTIAIVRFAHNRS